MRLPRTGTRVVLGLGLFILIGWFAYRPYIPPAWLHDLSADIALRAEADPNPPLPEDSRQETPRGLADKPYICVANVVEGPWDRIFAVTAKQDLRSHPVLAEAVWPERSLEDTAAELARDERYQVFVLVKDNTVMDAQLFYTFWGKLDDIARPEGYGRDEAVFTAASRGGVYLLSPAVDVPADACVHGGE
jgi:hypothetical protein